MKAEVQAKQGAALVAQPQSHECQALVVMAPKLEQPTPTPHNDPSEWHVGQIRDLECGPLYEEMYEGGYGTERRTPDATTPSHPPKI